MSEGRQSHVPKKGREEFEEQFNEMQKLLNSPGSKAIIQKIRDEDIVMFIGNTKSGKSTLVNYAIGNELTAVKKKILPFSMSIAKVNEEDEGPVIGLESVSETTLPTVWSAKQSGIREKVVDAPGFEDNRGEAQDIANAFYIKEIIRNARSAKFVLVADINDIMNDNIGSFTSFIDKINKIFPEIRSLEGGIVLIFSKAISAVSSRDICELLRQSILDQKKMIMTSKSLIKFFVDHEKYIAFFNKPVSEGRVDEMAVGGKLLDVIENGITGISGRDLHNAKPGISDKSRVLLLQLHSEFCNVAEYLLMLDTVKGGFAKKSVEIYEIESIKDVTKMDETLQGLQEKLDELMPYDEGELNLSKLLRKVRELGKIVGLANLTDDSNIEMKLQFVEFVDEALGLRNSAVYREKYLGTVEMIRNELHLARLRAATRLNKMTAEEAEREKRELKERHDEEMRKHAEEVRKIQSENSRKAQEELNSMGIVDHLAEAGKKILSGISSWFSW